LVRGLNDPAFSDPATTTNPSGNPVTYSSTDENVATVDPNTGEVALVAVGTTQILADQTGIDEYYNTAPQVSQTLIVIPALLPVNSGLACWYDADQGVTTDGSGVATWADSSTLGHLATRASGAPTLVPSDINGKPAVHLRGGSTWLNCAGGMFTKEQYIVVRSPNATWNGSGSFLGRKGTGNSGARASSYNLAGGTTGFWQDHFPAAVSKNGTPLPLNASGGSGYQGITPITDYMVLKITVDATADAANLAAYPEYQIGRNDNLGTCDMDIAEIIGYDHALSSAEASLMTAYLAQKYAVAVALPTTFSALTASQSIGAGTPSVTLSGTVSASGSVYPAFGAAVHVAVNGGTPQDTTISDNTGGFSIVFDTSAIPAGGPYTITYTYDATSPLAGATNTSTTLTVTPSGSDYDTWAGPSGYNLTGGIDDDDDGDGLSNRQEHAFGLNPTSGASVSPITVQLDPDGGTFTYTRRDPSLTNLAYSVWTSTDLGTWTMDGDAAEGVPTTDGNDVQTVPVTLSAAALATAVDGTLFVRVQADEVVPE
jgi:hypothetical protein